MQKQKFMPIEGVATNHPATVHRNNWLVDKGAFAWVHMSLLASQLFLWSVAGQFMARLHSQWLCTSTFLFITITNAQWTLLYSGLCLIACMNLCLSMHISRGISTFGAFITCCHSFCIWYEPAVPVMTPLNIQQLTHKHCSSVQDKSKKFFSTCYMLYNYWHKFDQT